MNLEEYRQLYGGDSGLAPGWEAIDARLDQLYGDQEPGHWAPTLPMIAGGPDPIDGISAYESKAGGIRHLHYCTYGYSELYFDEEAFGREFSKFGFEMTFRLASTRPAEDEARWVSGLLQSLARYAFNSQRWFEPYHWIDTGGPIRQDAPTDIVGLAFAQDPELQPIDTVHGQVTFIQAFGITSAELADLQGKTRTCQEIVDAQRASNPLLITDLARR